MNTCIYSKTKFEKANGEHILQNFLGGRWVSNIIVTNEIQHEFGKTIDIALEQGLKSIRNLLGTKGGRGGSGPTLKNMKSSQGTKYHIESGGKPQLAEPIVHSSLRADGRHYVQVQLGSFNQLGWAIAKIKKQFPSAVFNINGIRRNAVSGKTYLDEKLPYNFGIGGKDYFRGLLKSIFNLIGTMNHSLALSPKFDDLRDFIINGNGDSTKFMRWLRNDEELHIPNLFDFDHFIAVFSKNSCIEGVVQFYGDIPHLIRILDNYSGVDFSYSYLVDPFRLTEFPEIRNHNSFNKDLLPEFDDNSELPNEHVCKHYSTRFNRILKKYYEKADKDRICEIVNKVLVPYEGKPRITNLNF
ncbi:MAG: hypothetical protein ACUZ8O_04205 [Candidatus Anammoxibacter sp.]